MATHNHELLLAVRVIQRLLRQLPEDELNATYQVIANEANVSQWSSTMEPLQGVCLAFQAEFQRRAHLADEVAQGGEEFADE